jgi:CBS domain-containing protein
MSMRTVKTLLKGKGQEVWSIAPDASVYDAIYLMAEKGIGALIVLDGERLVGVISERDYARQIILKARGSEDTPVKDIMTKNVICAALADSIEDCMALISDNRVRHLPVVEDDRVIGVISIGDLVKAIIAEQQSTINDLERYITG